MLIELEYIRPGKGIHVYQNGLVRTHAAGLKFHDQFAPDAAAELTAMMLHNGWIGPEQRVDSITKYCFFGEYFDILLWYDTQGKLIGFYSDIATPLQKTATGYSMTDLFLDLWISPSGELTELDWDEFAEACEQGLLDAQTIEHAQTTMQRIVAEAATGHFPFAYIDEQHLRW